MKDLQVGARVAKKTKSKARQLERARQAIKRQERKEGRKTDTHFSALHLLHDAQGLAERLFAMLRKSTERFEVRLMMMNFISRLIGAHELLLLNFYPFVMKYLQPKQKGTALCSDCFACRITSLVGLQLICQVCLAHAPTLIHAPTLADCRRDQAAGVRGAGVARVGATRCHGAGGPGHRKQLCHRALLPRGHDGRVCCWPGGNIAPVWSRGTERDGGSNRSERSSRRTLRRSVDSELERERERERERVSPFFVLLTRGRYIHCSLNSMRLICSRCPLAMSPELAQDLVQYKSYKDKSMSRRSARSRFGCLVLALSACPAPSSVGTPLRQSCMRCSRPRTHVSA